MGLKVVISSLIDLNVDVIVNPVDSDLVPTGGVDLSIHDALNYNLYDEIKSYSPLSVGMCFIHDVKHMNFKHVIFTAPPTYSLNRMVERMLYITYEQILMLAKYKNLTSIGIPLIGSGAKGFPKEIALRIANDAIQDFLENNQLDIYLSLYDETAIKLLDNPKFKSIKKYLKEEKEVKKTRMMMHASLSSAIKLDEKELSFSYYLYELILSKGIHEVAFYKKCNIDRKLYSKIMSNGSYQPSKITAITLCLGLELNLDETLDLLQRAGYTLSSALTFDLIIKWCIENKVYNLFEVSELLLELNQKPLF